MRKCSATAAPAPFHSPLSNCTTSHSWPASWHSTCCTSAAEKAQHVFNLSCQKRHKGRGIALEKTNYFHLVCISSVTLYSCENIDGGTSHAYASKSSSLNDELHGWILFTEWCFSQLIICIVFWYLICWQIQLPSVRNAARWVSQAQTMLLYAFTLLGQTGDLLSFWVFYIFSMFSLKKSWE